MGFTGFYRVLPSFTEFYWVLPSFTGFYLVLPSFTGFYDHHERFIILESSLDLIFLGSTDLFSFDFVRFQSCLPSFS